MYVIIGASRGIGYFLFDELSNRGEIVIGTYNKTDLDKPNYYQLDILSEDSINLFVEKINKKYSNINLIICSGVNYNNYAHKSDIEEWSKVINVNVIGTFSIISKLLIKMRSDTYGRIITFSSVVAQKGAPGTSAYSASKAALWGLNKAIAIENAYKGITINSVNLGYFDIGMIKDVPANFKEMIKESIPTKQFGNPINILNAVDFIVKSDYLNGTSIDVNGLIY
jgi:acetoacetyl-CoA reductase/3-oxoacyl-[acyl-carrier protein] reductase